MLTRSLLAMLLRPILKFMEIVVYIIKSNDMDFLGDDVYFPTLTLTVITFRQFSRKYRELPFVVWEPNNFFEDLLHPLVRKLFLHLKEAVLHLQ